MKEEGGGPEREVGAIPTPMNTHHKNILQVTCFKYGL